MKTWPGRICLVLIVLVSLLILLVIPKKRAVIKHVPRSKKTVVNLQPAKRSPDGKYEARVGAIEKDVFQKGYCETESDGYIQITSLKTQKTLSRTIGVLDKCDFLYLNALAWAPDSRSFAAVEKYCAEPDGRIVVVSLDGRTKFIHQYLESDIRLLSFSPDGRFLAAGSVIYRLSDGKMFQDFTIQLGLGPNYIKHPPTTDSDISQIPVAIEWHEQTLEITTGLNTESKMTVTRAIDRYWCQ